MSLPLALLPYLQPPFLKLDADGNLVPNAGGFVYTYIAGTVTPQATYQDQNGDTQHSNPIVLDADGFPPGNQIFGLPTGYTIEVQDADAVTLYTFEFIEDVGSAFLDVAANIQVEGTDTSGAGPYVVQDTDNLVRVSSATSDPFVVQLPPASDRGTPLVIKNLSASDVDVTPDGTDTIEGLAAAYTLDAAVSPLMPTITLMSDGVSAWWITGGIGV